MLRAVGFLFRIQRRIKGVKTMSKTSGKKHKATAANETNEIVIKIPDSEIVLIKQKFLF